MAYCYLARRLDGFRLQIAQVRDLAFGQIICGGPRRTAQRSLSFDAAVGAFSNMWPDWRRMPAQCVLSVMWATTAHKLYFKTHPPLKSVVVYDVRQGMENLISERLLKHGMRSRTPIRGEGGRESASAGRK